MQAVQPRGACPATAARSPHVVNNDGDHGPTGQRKALAIYLMALGPELAGHGVRHGRHSEGASSAKALYIDVQLLAWRSACCCPFRALRQPRHEVTDGIGSPSKVLLNIGATPHATDSDGKGCQDLVAHIKVAPVKRAKLAALVQCANAILQ